MTETNELILELKSKFDLITKAIADEKALEFDYVSADMSIKRGRKVIPKEIKDEYLYAEDSGNIKRFLIDGIQSPTIIEKSAKDKELDELLSAIKNRITAISVGKDEAYKERNVLVAALSKQYYSHLCRHPETDTAWENDWRWIVCIHLPTGQATWHIHDTELGLFNHLDRGVNHFDGHSTEEKYLRVNKLPNTKEAHDN